jgi:deoxyadenosine/deoxycytidine kinase/NTP pyrophosphatase (non-canonical NTP hydrolase)
MHLFPQLSFKEPLLRQSFYIVIEGVIGVGKTTLARLLQPIFKAELLLEVFEENPFLGNFYSDRARYAFQTQLFFLLSRYHQQRQVVPAASARGTLISDYVFAKDRLFARLNLRGDELDMYERVHSILAENIPQPDLVIYLRADTDVLLERIAIRDRSYERDMDREYIDQLRRAYERFFAAFQVAPLLTIDTNTINFVQNPDDLIQITNQVRSALGLLPSQPALMPIAPTLAEVDRAVFDQGRRRLVDLQRWHQALDEEKGFLRDIYFNFICLTEEIGELGAVLARTWSAQARDQEYDGQAALEEELADCLAYLLKLANYAGIDLERAYLEKMRVNKDREWVK